MGKLALLLFVTVIAALVGAAMARRVYGVPGRPRLAAVPPRLALPPGPPGAAEMESSYGGEDERRGLRIRNRTKSSEVVDLASVPGWEAELRDRGHRRGFAIRIRRSGAFEPVEVVHVEGVLRAGARQAAIGLLQARARTA